MTTVTRLAVHTSPRKPYASAPLANNAGSCAFCSALSRGFTPWGGCALRASIPPARPRLSHWLTAPSLTPKATAMSFCFHPCSFRFQARLRRSSRQSADRRCSHTSYSTTSLLLSAEISKSYLTPIRNLPAATDSYTLWLRQILSQWKEQETRRRQIPPPQAPTAMACSPLDNVVHTPHK